MSSLNLPQALVDIDQSKLSASVREKVNHLVSLGHNRAHLMVNAEGDVHVSEELAMLHAE
ncbi:MAG: hypothetical protein SGJ27_17680 [Candidatus Melainabacteria bacterium]|nr:hypothetical protein [Candidatus Melainabacteria bacterium]